MCFVNIHNKINVKLNFSFTNDFTQIGEIKQFINICHQEQEIGVRDLSSSG
jgi:uncharacterized membrane protein